MRLAAACAHFGRDLDRCEERVYTLIRHARQSGVALLVLPAGALGGYLTELAAPGPADLPPALSVHDPIFRRLADLAGNLVVCVGFCEVDERGTRYNSAVCLSGAGVHGRYRKVHLPPGEATVYAAGDGITAFDTPVGRIGMLIDYDKTFPEAARRLTLDGADVVVILSAWPASVTRRASQIVHDRQTRLFDLYDCARAAENQVVVVSSNQSGLTGDLRFLGHAKIVGPGGEILARTGVKAGLAVADVEVGEQIGLARRVLHHVKERRVDAYDPPRWVP